MRRAVQILMTVCLTGTIVASLASSALAQEITGEDCFAAVGGKQPRDLTENKPLKLKKNDKIEIMALPRGPAINGATRTEAAVVLFGVRLPIGTEKAKGLWGGRFELPGYLKTITSGVHRIEFEATGKSVDCSGSAYIDLKGGPLTIALGLGVLLAGIGAAVALGARGSASNAPDKSTIARKTGIEDRGVKVAPDKLRTRAVDLAYLLVLAFIFYLAYEELIDLGESVGLALPAAAASSASGQRRVWMHGRVVRGSIGGLLLGLGIALVLQQFDIWPLDLTEGLLFPVGLAIASAVRAYLGSAFIVTPPPPEVDDRVLAPVGAGSGGAAEDAPTRAMAAPNHTEGTGAGTDQTQVIERPKDER